MKIRKGFVSNSSSSSFIVAVKQEGEVTQDDIQAVLDVPENCVLYSISVDIAEYFFKEGKPKTRKEFFDNYWYDPDDKEDQDEMGSLLSTINQLYLDGWQIRYGRASYNETDNPIEMLVGNNGLKEIDKPEFKFKYLY